MVGTQDEAGDLGCSLIGVAVSHHDQVEEVVQIELLLVQGEALLPEQVQELGEAGVVLIKGEK